MQSPWSFPAIFLVASVAVQSANAEICLWRDARSGVVRDTFYLEGGIVGIKDAASDRFTINATGLTQFNLSRSFSQSSNFTALFNTTWVIQDPLLRPHVNGFMFADEDEWYTFGGRAYPSVNSAKNGSGVSRDALYSPNTAATTPALGYTENLNVINSNSSTLYITNGAGVSVPGESLGFYFGGLRSPNSTHLSSNAPVNSSNYANIPVNTMLKVDTKSFAEPQWFEMALPPGVTSRTEAVLTWIPVGTHGALIVIGGVPFPASTDELCKLNATMTQLNNDQAPGYMKTLSVYDIASDSWYNQSTSGPTPPQLAQACAVVASANNTIHNIHVYGGYNGVDNTAPSDDVWILSVPSFTWIKVQSQNPKHGRFRHVCAKPYPDQMLVVGGSANCNQCLQTSAFANVFNLNSLTWTGSYDPKNWSDYVVPTSVVNAISAAPTASMDPALLALFNTPYPGRIPVYYPYKPAENNTAPNPPPTPVPTPVPGPSQPKWLIPVAVVVPIVAAIAAGVLVWWCMRRRRDQSATEGKQSRRSISQWLRGQPATDNYVRPDDETTQVGTIHSVHEAIGDTSYFPKNIARMNTAELQSESHPNSHFGSPLSSPGIPSPSNRGDVELDAPPTRYELPGMKRTSMFGNQNIKSHHMYPPSLGGCTTTGQDRSVSSPTIGPITPYELPQNRSNEEILQPAPNDMVLSHTNVHSPRITPVAHRNDGDSFAAKVSPSFSGADVSPQQDPVDVPITPPQQPIKSIKSTHTRNTSSLSSGLPDLSSPSPREDQRRSNHIATLPDSPSTEAHFSSTSKSVEDPVNNGITATRAGAGNLSPGTMQIPGLCIGNNVEKCTEKLIRRKELPNRSVSPE